MFDLGLAKQAPEPEFGPVLAPTACSSASCTKISLLVVSISAHLQEHALIARLV